MESSSDNEVVNTEKGTFYKSSSSRVEVGNWVWLEVSFKGWGMSNNDNVSTMGKVAQKTRDLVTIEYFHNGKFQITPWMSWVNYWRFEPEDKEILQWLERKLTQ